MNVRTHDGQRSFADVAQDWGCVACSSGHIACMWVPDPVLVFIKVQAWRHLVIMDHWLWGSRFDLVPEFPRAIPAMRLSPDDPSGGHIVKAHEDMTAKLAGIASDHLREYVASCKERRVRSHVHQSSLAMAKIERAVMALDGLAETGHDFRIVQQHAQQDRYEADHMVWALLACFLSKNRKDFTTDTVRNAIVRSCVPKHMQELVASVWLDQPSSATLSGRQLALDLSFALTFADSMATFDGAIFIWADASVQRKTDWLLSKDYVSASNLRRCYDAAIALSQSTDSFMMACDSDGDDKDEALL